MKFESDDYGIDCSSAASAVLRGVLRLPSPLSYEERFEPIRSAIDASTAYTIDITAVVFMNSSGITGLSRLVLHARGLDRPLTLVGAEAVPWHEKTLLSLKRLYGKVEVQLR
jgi:hypothetical protein